MKAALLFLLFVYSFNSFALGGYSSLSDSQKRTLSAIVKQLGIEDSNNSIKEKIYDASDFAISGNWSSYWTGLNELSISKYNESIGKGFIELAINNDENGTLFLTYVYKPETKQIILITKQIRYVDKKSLLDLFKERKANSKEYVIRHEEDGYALLQKKDKVNFEFYHVSNSSTSGSLTYQSQTAINI